MKTRVLAFALCLLLFCTACGGAPAESVPSEASIPESSLVEPGSPSSSAPALPLPPVAEKSEAPPAPEPSAPSEQSVTSEPSASGEQSAQDTAPSIAEPASAQVTDSPGEKLFQVGKKDLYELYLYLPGRLAYEMLAAYYFPHSEDPDHPIIAALNELPPLKRVDPSPIEQVQTGFLIVREDYRKTQANLYDRKLEVDGVFYGLTAEQYDTLKRLADEVAPEKGSYSSAQWLVWMNASRITGIECTDETGRTFQIMQGNVGLAALEARDISVTGAATYTPGTKKFDEMKNAFRTVLTFDSGITYTLLFEGDNLYLEATGMELGCRYKTLRNAESFINFMKNAENAPANPRGGKPVIYLYPEKTQDVSVTLNFRGVLFYTYPAYNGGWNVTAAPDGTLINKADGTTHYYLFWEGTSDFRDWDFSEGFVVKGSEVESFLKEKLPAMGLTPREYNDFITYWAPEMSRNDYNLVTFSTTQYEAIARLGVSPAPNTVSRVHMVYKPIPEPVPVKEQILPDAPRRNGFTVVEWGGTRAG